MPSTLSPPAAPARANPARARGLRRSRTAAPCPPIAVVAIPRKPTPAEVLVLISRVRQAEIDAGRLDQSRLFDLRVFKCVAAELGYYRRLAHAQTPSAHIATSMPQLVKGLAPLHPRWDMSGDAFAARDRHQSAVRRRLRVMAACELLTWQAGTNLEGEEVRTELLLLEPPHVSRDELKVARAQLARWQKQYGAGLNTGSTTGIRNVAKAAAEPSRAECHLRARNRVQQLRAARIRAEHYGGKMAPPFGTTSAFGEERNGPFDYVEEDLPPALSPSHDEDLTACGTATGARRTHAHSVHSPPRAVEGNRNSSIERRSGQLVEDLGPPADNLGRSGALSGAEFGEHVAARVAARMADPAHMQHLADEQARIDELAAMIAASAARRAGEIAGSPLERSWPTGRIREAWFVARFGATAAAGGAVHAFTLSPDRERQLLRVLRRYDAHVAEAPAGWPATAWAAFLHAAGTWQHRFPAGTIEGLDQLTVGMRGRATADDIDRLAAARRRAEGRRLAADAGPLRFRPLPDPGGRWPAWVRLDHAGAPVIELGPRGEQLAVDADHAFLPPAGDPHRVLVERDALLLAGRALPARLDGRRMVADRDRGHEPRSGYDPAARVDVDVLELARLTGVPVEQLLRLTAQLRADMLVSARVHAGRQAARERQQFLDRLGRSDGGAP